MAVKDVRSLDAYGEQGTNISVRVMVEERFAILFCFRSNINVGEVQNFADVGIRY